MTNLISHAEELATKPPVDVYKKLMQLFADEFKKDLEKEKPGPLASEYEKQDYQKTLKQVTEQLASKWDLLVHDCRLDGAKFSITAICDFAAMCMMMIAAGSERTEALKKALRGQSAAGTYKTPFGDHAHLYRKDGAGDFLKMLKAWCQLEKNGIIQFKFPANGDYHTFAIERTPNEITRAPEFIVYQAYQDTYSLADFLGIGTQSVLTAHYQRLWASMKPADQKKYQTKNPPNDPLKKFTSENMGRILRAAAAVGSERALDQTTLEERVLVPLQNLVRAQLPNKDYVLLTGSPTESQQINATYMLALVCDQISPGEFEANHEALNGVPAGLTSYLNCAAT